MGCGCDRLGSIAVVGETMNWNWPGIREYLLTLAGLPSTYEGLALIAAGVGIAFSPEHIKQIAAAAAVVVGLIRAGKRS